MAQATPFPFSHDRTRSQYVKARKLNRRAERRVKSAMLFLAFAFPAETMGA